MSEKRKSVVEHSVETKFFTLDRLRYIEVSGATEFLILLTLIGDCLSDILQIALPHGRDSK